MTYCFAGVYTTFVMFLDTLSVILTVLVLNLHHRSCKRPVPRWLYRLVFGFLARLLGVYSDVRQQYDVSSGLRHFTESLGIAAVNNASKDESRDSFIEDGFRLKSCMIPRFLKRNKEMKHVTKASSEYSLSLAAASQMKERFKQSSELPKGGRPSVSASLTMELNGVGDCISAANRTPNCHVPGHVRDYSTVYNTMNKNYNTRSFANDAMVANTELCANCRQAMMTMDEYGEVSAWKEVAQIIDRLFFWLTFVTMIIVDAWIFYELQQ